MSLLIDNLRNLYVTPHPLHDARTATLRPLATRARVAIAAHGTYDAMTELVLAAAALSVPALAPRVRRNLMANVTQLVNAATVIKGRGHTADVVDALEGAEAAVDGAPRDREFEAAIQKLTKIVERTEGCVAGLRAAADRLYAAIDALEPHADDLASPEIVTKETR